LLDGVLAREQSARLKLEADILDNKIDNHGAGLTETLRRKQVVAAILLRGDRVLICQRTEQQAFALQWEFPGGKVEVGEELAGALARELDEELGIRAVIGPKIATVQHQYAEGLAVELHFFLVTEFVGEIENRIFREVRWEERAALDAESFLEADRGVVQQLRSGELG
jgi:8-oxo-dGTP diphosphatase